jgi:maleamate amidohydrolase
VCPCEPLVFDLLHIAVAETMNDWQRQTGDDYRRKGLAHRMGCGLRPALLVVDFINGFTDPSSPLGGDLSAEIEATARLASAFRHVHLPVVFTRIAYEPDLRDAGMWIRKVPALHVLKRGTRMIEVDSRIPPAAGETVVDKRFASAFFGTDLDNILSNQGVDTVVMTGCTTSGCIRSSAVDAIQYGYYCAVVREAVGDRAPGPHESNLFDIDAKYGDVVSEHDVVDYLNGLGAVGSIQPDETDAFQRWWRAPAGGRTNA